MGMRRIGWLGLGAITAAFLLALALSDTLLAGDCDDHQHGCARQVNVPCERATCKDQADFPSDQLPPVYCSYPNDVAVIYWFSATPAASWYKCEENLTELQTPPYQTFKYPYCGNDTSILCANVYFFTGASCTTVCREGFISKCGFQNPATGCP